LQGVAVCCSVLQCVAAQNIILRRPRACVSVICLCCRMLQCIAMCCNVLQFVAARNVILPRPRVENWGWGKWFVIWLIYMCPKTKKMDSETRSKYLFVQICSVPRGLCCVYVRMCVFVCVCVCKWVCVCMSLYKCTRIYICLWCWWIKKTRAILCVFWTHCCGRWSAKQWESFKCKSLYYIIFLRVKIKASNLKALVMRENLIFKGRAVVYCKSQVKSGPNKEEFKKLHLYKIFWDSICTREFQILGIITILKSRNGLY